MSNIWNFEIRRHVKTIWTGLLFACLSVSLYMSRILQYQISDQGAFIDSNALSIINMSNYISSISSGRQINGNAFDQGSFRETTQLCQIDCQWNVPCSYRDEVDLRIMVLTYDRAESLIKCLDKIRALDTVGDRLSVEIWIDRSKNGSVDDATIRAAEIAKRNWTNGRLCVHIQHQNAYIGGQWRNTWRPKPNTTEIGLILEDDIDVSPYTYRYLKAVTEKYGNRDDISGYTLQMHNVRFYGLNKTRRMKGPASDSVFLYGVFGAWGFAPRPKAWRDFQDWFQNKDDNLRPIVPGIKPTEWYEGFERRHKEASMWTMWFIHFTNISNTYCVYCNLLKYTGKKDVLLSVNRKENGLHYTGNASTKYDPYLLRTWHENYITFPDKITKYDYDGNQLK